MSRPVVVQGSRVHELKQITTSTLIFHQIGDTKLPHPVPSIQTANLYYHYCDKNFVYHSLFPHNFNGLKAVYLNSSPCEPKVLTRFRDYEDITIYLHERYQRYKERWASDLGNIKMITDQEYRDKLMAELKNLDETEGSQ